MNSWSKNEEERKPYRGTIGGSFLIVVFIVLCLVSFSLLSLSSAKNQWDLAVRNSQSVREYYEADLEGEAFYHQMTEYLNQVCEAVNDPTERTELLKEVSGGGFDGQKAAAAVPLSQGRALMIELTPRWPEHPGDKGNWKVDRWETVMTEDYQIDQSMPVWTGDGER